MLQTLRSHDQYNTTIYGLDDRYRGRQGRPPGGVRQPRRHRDDAACPTATASTWCPSSPAPTATPGATREGLSGRAVLDPGRQRRGLLPRDQPLVPLDHTAAKSNTPVSKAVVIRLESAWAG